VRIKISGERNHHGSFNDMPSWSKRMTENENEQLQFLPFHAINEFMRPDFRLKVIRETLSVLDSISEETRNSVNHMIRKHVKVPGFRNSEKAPALVKVVPTSKAFEKSPDLVAAILLAWSESKPTLQQQVFDMLASRGWKVIRDINSVTDLSIPKSAKDWAILPLTANRCKLPGFITDWPKGEDFEALYNYFIKLYPECTDSIDQISLMVVWLTLRLPYNIVEDENKPDASDGDDSLTKAEAVE
jgi:hypothetical protein